MKKDWGEQNGVEPVLVETFVEKGRFLGTCYQAANIPQACQSRARTKAAYRFLDNKESTMETILSSHYQSTMNRIEEESVVLAVQDTTSLNYSLHPATENLGPIGSKGNEVIGLMVHDTMAFNREGTPLGLVGVQCWASSAVKSAEFKGAVRMVASLGGFLGRKGDGEPGTKTLWLGIQRLDDMTAMWKVFVTEFTPPIHCLHLDLSSKKCG